MTGGSRILASWADLLLDVTAVALIAFSAIDGLLLGNWSRATFDLLAGIWIVSRP